MFNKLTKSYLINSLVDVHDLLFTHPDLKKNVELKINIITKGYLY